MAYPKPEYTGTINPSSIDGVNLSEEDTAIKVYQAVRDYLNDSSFMFHKSSRYVGGPTSESYDRYSYLTQNSIIIQSTAETKKGPNFHTERVPLQWHIQLFSFSTPVENAKKELEEIILNASKD